MFFILVPYRYIYQYLYFLLWYDPSGLVYSLHFEMNGNAHTIDWKNKCETNNVLILLAPEIQTCDKANQINPE